MSKRFITTILAGAVAIAGLSAQPVQAGNDQIGRFILGATTLVILGTVLQASRQNDSDKRKTQRSHPPQTSHTPAYEPAHKPKPKVHRRASLPEYCLRSVRSNKGPRTIYGNRCMRDNYTAYNALPNSCRAKITGPDGVRRGFKPGCLYRAGFRA